jgi:hypothetical protein
VVQGLTSEILRCAQDDGLVWCGLRGGGAIRRGGALAWTLHLAGAGELAGAAR